MSIKVQVLISVDCTVTGVTGHYKPAAPQFVDRVGNTISTREQWEHSRNCQRNWETIMQIIGLYTQPQNITEITKQDNFYSFEFDVEFDGVFQSGNDPLGLLKESTHNVPVIGANGIEFLEYGKTIFFNIILDK